MNQRMVGLAAVASLMLLPWPQAAEAALVSVKFTIEITDISWDEHRYQCTNLPPMAVGDIFPGSITYEDVNVPGTGAYTIGFPGDFPPVDEFQYWGMSFHSPVWGAWQTLSDSRHEAGRTYPHLLFLDGLPFAMDMLAHYDTQAHEDEGFARGGYFATGWADLVDPEYPDVVIEQFYRVEGDGARPRRSGWRRHPRFPRSRMRRPAPRLLRPAAPKRTGAGEGASHVGIADALTTNEASGCGAQFPPPFRRCSRR